MTPEETIRNLINRSSPRKGTGRILLEKQNMASPEHPSQLSPMDLAKKEGTPPDKLAQRAKEIEDSREKLRQDRMKFDAERPQGQPASFTPTGEAPKPGETSSGVKVPQPGTPEFAARRELERISAQRPPVDRSATQQPTPPQTQTEKPQADMAATSSSVPNPRMAGGGVQTGSGLNVSNIQAGQHSFTRQPLRASYDPMESRKNFIRESVILSLNETNLRKSERWQRKAQKTLGRIEAERDVLKRKIDALSQTPAGRVASYPLRLDRAELTPQHDAAIAALAQATARVKKAKDSGNKRKNQREEDAAVKDAERRAERAWER